MQRLIPTCSRVSVIFHGDDIETVTEKIRHLLAVATAREKRTADIAIQFDVWTEKTQEIQTGRKE